MTHRFSENNNLHSIDLSIQHNHIQSGETSFLSHQKVNGELFIFSIIGLLVVYDKEIDNVFIGQDFLNHIDLLKLTNEKRFYNWLILNENDESFDQRFQIFGLPSILLFNRNKDILLNNYYSKKELNEVLIREHL